MTVEEFLNKNDGYENPRIYIEVPTKSNILEYEDMSYEEYCYHGSEYMDDKIASWRVYPYDDYVVISIKLGEETI